MYIFVGKKISNSALILLIQSHWEALTDLVVAHRKGWLYRTRNASSMSNQHNLVVALTTSTLKPRYRSHRLGSTRDFPSKNSPSIRSKSSGVYLTYFPLLLSLSMIELQKDKERHGSKTCWKIGEWTSSDLNFRAPCEISKRYFTCLLSANQIVPELIDTSELNRRSSSFHETKIALLEICLGEIYVC